MLQNEELDQSELDKRVASGRQLADDMGFSTEECVAYLLDKAFRLKPKKEYRTLHRSRENQPPTEEGWYWLKKTAI